MHGFSAWLGIARRLRTCNAQPGRCLRLCPNPVVEVSESTLYPVLRRLQKDGALTVYDEPFNGRNRRYYRLTDIGRERLARYVSEWETFQEGVDKLLLGGIGDDQE